jgi:protein-S-isoprenylcysteine O-methyltransferase Ste14
LGLSALYLCLVRINLGALWRGDLSVLVLLIQECCVIALTLPRRRARTIADWESPEALLAYAGTLGPLFIRPAELAPAALLWAGVAVQGIGNVLAVAGICQLGRSFGLVAANRGVQTGGLYGFVRHPIYAAYLLAFGGFALAHPSAVNTAVLLVWAGVQIARIRAEERLLRQDAAYLAYLRLVRYRLIPGLW